MPPHGNNFSNCLRQCTSHGQGYGITHQFLLGRYGERRTREEILWQTLQGQSFPYGFARRTAFGAQTNMPPASIFESPRSENGGGEFRVFQECIREIGAQIHGLRIANAKPKAPLSMLDIPNPIPSVQMS